MNSLPGYLLLVRFFTDDSFDDLDPEINVALIDDNRSGDNVIERRHSHFLVEIEEFHREITLEPESLTMRRKDFSILDAFERVRAVIYPYDRQTFVREFRVQSHFISDPVSPRDRQCPETKDIVHVLMSTEGRLHDATRPGRTGANNKCFARPYELVHASRNSCKQAFA